MAYYNYTISTSNVDSWTQEIDATGQGAFFSQQDPDSGGTGNATASNSADYISTPGEHMAVAIRYDGESSSWPHVPFSAR